MNHKELNVVSENLTPVHILLVKSRVIGLYLLELSEVEVVVMKDQAIESWLIFVSSMIFRAGLRQTCRILVYESLGGQYLSYYIDQSCMSLVNEV